MVYQGTVVKGVIVPDRPGALREGTRVRIEPLGVETGSETRQHFHPVGEWEGPPGELDRLLKEVQELRDADLALEDARDGTVPA